MTKPPHRNDGFYQSQEWHRARGKAIKSQGRKCFHCGKPITEKYDLIVNHLKPRTKFPHLALVQSNLQVSCRRCDGVINARNDRDPNRGVDENGLPNNKDNIWSTYHD